MLWPTNSGRWGYLLALLMLGAAPPARGADSATTRPATTAPAEAARTTPPVWGGAAVARRMIDSGDGRVAGTLLAWLAGEGEGLRMWGGGSGRLREAVRGAEALRLTEAVPSLATLAESDRALESLRRDAALAVARIDPGYDADFFRAIMRRESRSTPGVVGPACAAAAAALVANGGDAAAREFLLDGYKARLDALAAGRPAYDAYALEIGRLADGPLRDAVRQLATKYTVDVARRDAGEVVEQMRVNGLGEEALLAACVDAGAGAADDRRRAVIALGRRGGPAAAERLVGLTAGGGKQATAGAGGDALAATATGAVAELRQRHRLGHADGVEPPAAARIPAELPPASGVWVLENIAAAAPGRAAALSLVSADGRRPAVLASPADDGVLADAQAVGAWDLASVTFDPADPHRVVSVAGYDARPAETARDGYVLVEKRQVADRGTTRSAVVLAKLGRRVVARIPNRTGADGRTVPDSALSRALAGLSPGDAVEARLEESGGLTMLAWVGPYRPAVVGRFVRRVEAPRAAGGVGGGVAPGIVVAVGRRERTFVAPPPGPRRLTLDVGQWDDLFPGAVVAVMPEDEAGGGRDGATVMRDLRWDGKIGWALGGHTSSVSVRSRRASWFGGGLGWGPGDTEASMMEFALFRARSGGEAHPFKPDVVAALKEIRPPTVPYDVTAQVREPSKAWAVEQDPRRREVLEQQLFAALQRYSWAMELATEARDARVKVLLGDEGYRALLKLAAAPFPSKGGAGMPRTRPAGTTRPTAGPAN